MSGRKVVLPGATGQIGIFAIPRLLAAGFEVEAVSRAPRPSWFPELEGVRWIGLEVLRSGAVCDAEMLLSTGPLDVAAELAGRCPGLQRAVVFSTSSVFSKIESRDRREKSQMEQIVMGEANLSSMCASRSIPLTLLRPTLVYGCGLDGNVSWLARWIRKFGFMPLAGKAAGLRQPVHADDLAQAAVAVLSQVSPLALDVPLCGGSTLSYREMVEKIFRALDRPVRMVSLPGGLLAALVRLGRLNPNLRAVRPEMVRRQSLDLVFDDAPARDVLDYRPRPFAPGAGDFELPTADTLAKLALR